MIDRRKFLERSVMGAGSVLLSSVLLESCTKYGIPFPGGKPHPGGGGTLPPLTEEIDWNDDAREAVMFGIGKIPEAGEVLSALVGALWPVSNSPFDKMKSQVEALIDQKFNQDKYNEVKGTLGDIGSKSGLAGVLVEYTSAVNALAKNPEDTNSRSAVYAKFTSAQTTFINDQNQFKESGYEVLLLPLFAQYANMFLALLRDAALHGTDWNMTEDEINGVLNDLESYIGQWRDYVDKHYPDGVNSALAYANDATKHTDDKASYHYVEPFWSTNAYSRQTTFDVLDFRDTWEYYDVRKYPNGKTGTDGGPIKASELLTREIYSDPRGTTMTAVYPNRAPDYRPIPLPSPLLGAPSSLPTQIEVWAGDRIDAIRVTYPQGGGPGGITQTARMGGTGGNTSPDGGVLANPSSDPITQFLVGTLSVASLPRAPILSFLQFNRSSQNGTKLFGGKDTIPKDNWGWVGYPARAVSSIYIGAGVKIQSSTTANCIVVGFKHWDSPTLALRTVRLHYVTSPREKTMADLVKAFPGVAIPAGLIQEAKAERLAHWARIEASAKKK